tara:strand:- start:25516 stop:27018 length:1503 start_codon:yes stop_codon:yes gene_type:complete
MNTKFIELKWKQFSRAPQFGAKLGVKVLIGFFIIYFSLAAIFFSGISVFLLEKEFPDQSPLSIVNSYLLYYFVLGFVFRYFFQSLPSTEIQQLLITPITKKKIILNTILKSTFSIYNSSPIFWFLPFAIVFIFSGGPGDEVEFSRRSIFGTFSWWVCLQMITWILNNLVFLVNKNSSILKIIIVTVVSLYSLQRFDYFDIFSFFGSFLDKVYSDPIWIFIVISILILSYYLLFNFLIKQCYLDKALSKRKEKLIGKNLSFLDRFGSLGVLIKNDIRLILRNVRAKQVILMSFFFLFYGIIFFTPSFYNETGTLLVFASIFITGGFMMTFGQYVPSWDSEYYSLLMTQNLSYRKYLESKLVLMITATVIATILSLPYLYYGLKIYSMIVAGAFFNMGLGGYITLLSGVLNKSPIKLNIKAKAFENTQAYSLTQFLFVLPKMGLPVLIYWLGKTMFSEQVGILLIGLSGLLAFFLHSFIINQIEKVYKKQKYKTLEAYNTNN